MMLVNRKTNELIETIPQDEGDFIPIYVKDNFPPFKFPMNLVKMILQSCDANDVVNMVGEDSIVACISLDGIFRVFKIDEIFEIFNVRDGHINQEWMDEHELDSDIFERDMIYKIADDRGLFEDYASDSELYTWESFWESLEAEEVAERFGTNLLSHFDKDSVIEHYGWYDLIASQDLDDTVECLLDIYQLDDVIQSIGIESLIEECDLDETLKYISLKDIIDYHGMEDIFEEADDEDIAVHLNPEILSTVDSDDLGKNVDVNTLMEALQIAREL